MKKKKKKIEKKTKQRNGKAVSRRNVHITITYRTTRKRSVTATTT